MLKRKLDRIKTEHRFRYLTCERENHDEHCNKWPMCRLSSFVVILDIVLELIINKKFILMECSKGLELYENSIVQR